jgi:hypothetical protein
LKSPKWICSLCKQPFTRKWNSIRHCNTQHDGIDSIISFSEYLMIAKNRTYANFSNPNLYSYKTNPLSNQENMFFQDKPSIFSSYPHVRLTQEDTIDDDFRKKEILLSNILDKLAPKYEEIGNLLSHIPEPQKSWILGGIISIALYADNPIRFINNQLKDLRKAKLHNRMLDDASVFLGCNKQSTKEYLKMGLKEDAMD